MLILFNGYHVSLSVCGYMTGDTTGYNREKVMARTAAIKQVTFTDKFIAGLKPTDERYIKREARGFAIRVMPTGLKTFVYIYTFKGIRHQLNLGAYPGVTLAEARQRYTSAYSTHQQGIDPGAKEEDQCNSIADTTFGHFAGLYQAWALEHRSEGYNKTIKYALRNDIIPYWKDIEIADIRRADAIALLERVTARGAAVRLTKKNDGN